MVYQQRLATIEDASAIAPLWSDFAIQRAKVNPSLKLKPDFDFEKYVTRQLQKPNAYCFVLENQDSDQNRKTIVGFLYSYVYNEAPRNEALLAEYQWQTPFLPRYIGSVLGLYVSPEHRQAKPILILIKAAILKAKELAVTDIDIVLSEDQKALQKIVRKYGFVKATVAIQYTKIMMSMR